MSNNEKFIGSKVGETTPDIRYVNLKNLTKGTTYYVRIRAYTTTSSGAKMYTDFTPFASFVAK